MRNEEQVGYQIKELGRLLDRNIYQKSILNAGGDAITAMHGWMIGYLYHHRDEEVFQKDMEAEGLTMNFVQDNQSSSTKGVLRGLQNLEKNGYITRVSVERDARLKKITLTEDGMRFHDEIQKSIDHMEEKLVSGLTKEQRQELFSMLSQVKEQLEDEISSDAEKLEKEGKNNARFKNITCRGKRV